MIEVWTRAGKPSEVIVKENTLGIERICLALARCCDSDLGARQAESVAPLANANAAAASMARIEQARRVLAEGSRTTIHSRLDVADHLTMARRGGVLGGQELLRISAVARCAEKIADRADSWVELAPDIAAMAAGLPTLGQLADLAGNTFDDEGTLLDEASAELARLRAELRRRGAGLRHRIADLVRETDEQGILQDDYFTIRDGRYVLPVKSSDRSQVAGIVHGSSGTGQTIYVEPTELVEANNKLTIIAGEARREEHRILAALTAEVAESAPTIARACTDLARLDLLFGGAVLANRLEAAPIAFNDQGRLDLRDARHPLLVLEEAAVVGNHILIEAPARWLVVSGPNGGGKTVVLTTAGLAVEMARRGLPICAGSGSTLPWLVGVHVVLGDAQDLDRGLSTFSGHLEQVKSVLEAVPLAGEGPDGDRLVLLDELASGTEPSAGSALATALLETFGDRPCLGLLTTHYETVKLLPLRDPRFANAALDLNARSLAPDFRLRLGEVGSSSPFALADRLALPTAIVDRARQLAGGGSRETEQLVARLRGLRDDLDRALEQAEQERRQIDHARRLLDDQRRNEKRAADRRIEQAAAAALAEVESIRKEMAVARKQLREKPSQRHVEHTARVVGEGRKKAAAIHTRAVGEQSPGAQRPEVELATLVVDAPVWHLGLERLVTVTEIDRGRSRLRVRAGPLEMAVGLEQIRAPRAGDTGVAAKRVRTETRQTSEPASKIDEDQTLALRTARWTCDLRGMRVDEALDEVDRHLDRAVIEAAVGACLIHGVGTGALRDAVGQHLRKHPQVAHHRLGRQGEGGDGVTMVWVER